MFGLGQSKHFPEQYQRVGKVMDARMEGARNATASRSRICSANHVVGRANLRGAELGATRVLARAEGDDSGDIEADFENWQEKLFDVIEQGPSASAAGPAVAPIGEMRAPPSAAPAPKPTAGADIAPALSAEAAAPFVAAMEPRPSGEHS